MSRKYDPDKNSAGCYAAAIEAKRLRGDTHYPERQERAPDPEMAGLDPYAYLERPPHRRVTLKTIAAQVVTPPVPCETGDGR
ncbi:hypothetical protein FJ422_30815 [Mesorhizobium sp. B2-6-3]|uniref:hypothetical protein n=1 Tax=Mesorhizobium sp. B2-6-3 TaxID=2589914 RepID=UPI001128C60C|nr:hypothetical protein [Mesorhizobium sp. B2-6-3]TPJ75812.1 hypothetical protein FJ422_30815 [Mesorhizobium sp. B2-6-3]